MAEMQKLWPDFDWKDEDRISALCSPLRHRDVNPDSWDSKVAFWTKTIEMWLREQQRSSFQLLQILPDLVMKSHKPYCIHQVVDIAIRNRDLTTLSDLEAKWANQRASWFQWGFRLVTNSAWALLPGFIRPSPNSERHIFVSESILQFHALKALDTLMRSQVGFRLQGSMASSSEKLLSRDQVEQLCPLPDLDLVLKSLCASGHCDVAVTPEGVLIYAFRQNGSNCSPVRLGDKELNFFRLSSLHAELNASLIEIEQQKSQLMTSVRLAARTGQRSAAKLQLKRCKRLENSIDKKQQLVDNLDRILNTIEDADTDKKVADSYAAALQLLKQELSGSKSVEQTEELVDQLGNYMDQVRSISQILSSDPESSATVDDDEALLAELDALDKEDCCSLAKTEDQSSIADLEEQLKTSLILPSVPEDEPTDPSTQENASNPFRKPSRVLAD